MNIAHIHVRTIRHINTYTVTKCYISPMETRLTQFSSKFRMTSSGQAFVGVVTPSYCVVILWLWSQSGPVEIMGVLGSRIISPIICFIRGVDLIDPHSVPRTQMRQWSSSMM